MWREHLNDCHRVDTRQDKKLVKKDCLSWYVSFGERLYHKKETVVELPFAVMHQIKEMFSLYTIKIFCGLKFFSRILVCLKFLFLSTWTSRLICCSWNTKAISFLPLQGKFKELLNYPNYGLDCHSEKFKCCEMKCLIW